ncbi:MAG TPA: hypothetical protein VIF81_02785, partial [Pyrinomonadaceae bacterium]
MNKLTLSLLGTFMAILVVSGVLAYAFRDQSTASSAAPQASPGTSPSAGDKGSTEKQKGQSAAETQKQNGGRSAISELFGLDSPS